MNDFYHTPTIADLNASYMWEQVGSTLVGTWKGDGEPFGNDELSLAMIMSAHAEEAVFKLPKKGVVEITSKSLIHALTKAGLGIESGREVREVRR